MAAAVRPRRAADTREVRRVARAAWRATYEKIAPAAFIGAVLRGAYARDRLLRGLIDPRRDALVAEEDSHVVGYAEVVEEPRGACELVRLYVSPDAQGHGIGRALLAGATAGARLRNVASLSVSVDRRNRRAQAWYRRQGFVPAGRSTFDFRGWSRPQAVMSLTLSPTPVTPSSGRS